jgi:DNA-binding response OmpR family regulator
LIVDDEPGIQRIFELALGNYGFVTVGALDASMALEKLDQERFDFIVIDVNMPGHDGVELVRLLRERGCATPIVLMSGRPLKDGTKRALNDEGVRFLMKPVMPSELRGIVQASLALARNAPTLREPPASSRRGVGGRLR